MKCPGCGREMPSESLFCENCGYEIKIVPDYDPLDELPVGEEIEGREEIFEDTGGTADGSGAEPHKKAVPQRDLPPAQKSRGKRAACIVLVSVIAAAVVFGIVSYRYSKRGNSYEYQFSAGMSLYEEGGYAEAAAYLAKALALQGGTGDEGKEILETLAYCYAYTGENEAAADCIMEAIINAEESGADTDELYEMYKTYMEILNLTGQTQLVNDTVENLENEELKYLLYDYRISTPECSEEEGTYTYYLRIELTAAFGDIYYTLDGSDPTEDGKLYNTAFVLLNEGLTTLRAVAVNKAGMVSPELTMEFTLEFAQDEAYSDAEY